MSTDKSANFYAQVRASCTHLSPCIYPECNGGATRCDRWADGFAAGLEANASSVVLMPAAAVETVCHDEQMTVWESDFTGMLSLGGWLRDDLDYDEQIEMGDAIKRELRSIIGMAFSHPEAKTIKKST